MQKFRTKGWCKILVVLEMILAALTVFLTVGLVFYKLSEPDLEDNGYNEYLPKPIQVTQIPVLVMTVLSYVSFVFRVVLFFAGQRVLSEACSLSPQTMDCNKLEAGIKSCDFFCILELIRMVLILMAFFGEIFLLNISLVMQSIGIATNAPVIFGWFFTSEFRNELKIHREELTTGRNLYPLPPSHSFSGWNGVQQGQGRNVIPSVHGVCGDNDIHRENREFGETMMYSAPGIAYCMNNLMR